MASFLAMSLHLNGFKDSQDWPITKLNYIEEEAQLKHIDKLIPHDTDGSANRDSKVSNL